MGNSCCCAAKNRDEDAVFHFDGDGGRSTSRGVSYLAGPSSLLSGPAAMSFEAKDDLDDGEDKFDDVSSVKAHDELRDDELSEFDDGTCSNGSNRFRTAARVGDQKMVRFGSRSNMSQPGSPTSVDRTPTSSAMHPNRTADLPSGIDTPGRAQPKGDGCHSVPLPACFRKSATNRSFDMPSDDQDMASSGRLSGLGA